MKQYFSHCLSFLSILAPHKNSLQTPVSVWNVFITLFPGRWLFLPNSRNKCQIFFYPTPYRSKVMLLFYFYIYFFLDLNLKKKSFLFCQMLQIESGLLSWGRIIISCSWLNVFLNLWSWIFYLFLYNYFIFKTLTSTYIVSVSPPPRKYKYIDIQFKLYVLW